MVNLVTGIQGGVLGYINQPKQNLYLIILHKALKTCYYLLMTQKNLQF